MLQIRDIRKTYSTGKVKVEALKGISLDFPEKGLVFIVAVFVGAALAMFIVKMITKTGVKVRDN